MCLEFSETSHQNWATRNADAKRLEATDVEMNAEDQCAAQVKRAKTIMGLETCVLEALDDVFDKPPETLTNLAGTPCENEKDEELSVNMLQVFSCKFRSRQSFFREEFLVRHVLGQ